MKRNNNQSIESDNDVLCKLNGRQAHDLESGTIGTNNDNDEEKSKLLNNVHNNISNNNDPLLQIYFDINQLTTSSTQTAASYVNRIQSVRGIDTIYARRGTFIRKTWRQTMCSCRGKKGKTYKQLLQKLKRCCCISFIVMTSVIVFLIYKKYLEDQSDSIYSDLGDDDDKSTNSTESLNKDVFYLMG